MTLRDGTIYFLEAVGAGRVKIGFATNLDARLASLAGQCPFPTRLIANHAGSYVDEQHIHKMLVDHRVHGEWFYMVDRVLMFAKDPTFWRFSERNLDDLVVGGIAHFMRESGINLSTISHATEICYSTLTRHIHLRYPLSSRSIERLRLYDNRMTLDGLRASGNVPRPSQRKPVSA